MRARDDDRPRCLGQRLAEVAVRADRDFGRLCACRRCWVYFRRTLRPSSPEARFSRCRIPRFISFGFEPSLIIPFAIAGLASGLRVIGVLTTCQQMNDAAWRRPDMKNIEAGVMADGIGCAVGGALGAPGMSASPSLVGIEKTTGATSRVIAWSIAGWLVLLACFPKFSSLIVSMPRPVMAAALFFNGSLMFVAGIQIVASRPITLRASLIVGFSVLIALSVMIFPEFYKSLPAWTHQFTESEITAAVITSVALNAIFLLGTWRYGHLRLGDDGAPLTAESFDDFFVQAGQGMEDPAQRMSKECDRWWMKPSNRSQPTPKVPWRSVSAATASTSG